MVRRLGAAVLAVLLLLPGQVRAAEEKGITARGWALMEAESGRLLMGENEGEKLPMASTTKIMTALLILEAGEDLDTLVTVPKEAAKTEGSSLHLSAGERLSLRDLLYGLMMVSGNDAAVALAVHLDGSVAAFADRMNRRAADLGCENTHFTNPHGLHDPDHYTCALDLCRIARAAMALPLFRALVSAETYAASTGSRPRTFRTKNRVLTQIEGGCGVKTGYTKKAGRCLCFAAQRQGMLLIGAALNAPDMWADAETILDRGFAAFILRPFLSPGQTVGRVAVDGGMKKALPAAAKEGILYPVRRDGSEAATVQVRLLDRIPAPVEQGCVLGEAALLVDGTPVLTVPLIAREGAQARRFGAALFRVMEGYLIA